MVRHFDPLHVARLEARHGLQHGSLVAAAFEPDLIDRVITGVLRRREWIREVGRRVGHITAAEEWMAERGTVDTALLFEVDALRSKGHVVAVLTNGTDTIADEMIELGLTERLDAVFNSADIGFAKPDRRAFEHVCAALDVAPAEVFFTDDSQLKLRGAIEIGMTARLFVGVDGFRQHLSEVGLRGA